MLTLEVLVHDHSTVTTVGSSLSSLTRVQHHTETAAGFSRQHADSLQLINRLL